MQGMKAGRAFAAIAGGDRTGIAVDRIVESMAALLAVHRLNAILAEPLQAGCRSGVAHPAKEWF